jgi:putative ABC transport system permease protein
MNYFTLAVRNILRHRRRSIVTVATVTLGFVALGVLNGFLTNIFSRLKSQAIVSEKLGHLTLAKEGFAERGKLEPDQYLWTADELRGILKVAQADPDVLVATPRIRMFGVASNGKASTLFVSEAIVPADDQKLVQTPIDGRVDTLGNATLQANRSQPTDVVIGSELSTLLGLGKGKTMTLLTTTKDGVANAIDVRITDVYNTGNPGTNDKFVLTNFAMAQELYDTGGAERVVLTVKNPDDVNAVKERLTASLTQAGYKIEARTWQEQSVTYQKVTTMFGVIFRVLTIIITVIVLLTLLNTMQIVVSERTKEIGTMRAIGMLRAGIVRLFCLEGLLMGLAGCALAVPVLFLISTILKAAQITFIPPVASVPVPLVLMLNPQRVVFVFVLFTVAALISSFLVARKIANQQIVNSLMDRN